MGWKFGSRDITIFSVRGHVDRRPGKSAGRPVPQDRTCRRWTVSIEIWGDGHQTRSFLYVSECVEATLRLMRSDFAGPVNIGSEEMVTIDELAEMIMQIAKKRLEILHIPGPLGVRGRNSDNRLIRQKLDWAPSQPLSAGIEAPTRGSTSDAVESGALTRLISHCGASLWGRQDELKTGPW